MKNQIARNKQFKSVKDKLEFIQKECKEVELFEDLKQLYKNKGFENVRITHGTMEFGKDLVFSLFDKSLNKIRWYSVIVKNKPASQNDFMPDGEIGKQIQHSFKVPYRDNSNNEIFISSIFIIINGNIGFNAKEIISRFIEKHLLEHIIIIDYQDLEKEISNFSKDEFLDNIEPTINNYVKETKRILSDISSSNSIYELNMSDINEIFINVQTTYNKEIQKINKYVTFDGETRPALKPEELDETNEILNCDKNFVIHGIATSGKSLLLKRLGIKAIEQKLLKLNSVFYVDLLEANGILDIESLISKKYKIITKGEEYLRDDFNKEIILFDSIDFIRDEDERIKLIKVIEEYSKNNLNKKSQIIFATRNIETLKKNNLLTDFEFSELLPFNFNQALKLVKKIIPNNNVKTNNFIKAIKNTLLDSTLQRTPLSLTLMAILYRDDKIDLKELPANIYELYNKFTDIYLERWDSTKGINQQYKYEQIKIILSFVAFELHENGNVCINSDDLKIFLKKLRKSYNYDELNNIDGFVEYLKTNKGVFNFDSVRNEFYFFNHYFQEFFASNSIEDDDSCLINNFFNEWWSNALVFHCGKNPRSIRLHNSINKIVIPSDSFLKHYYINLHSKCLQASHAVSIIERQKIVEKIIFQYDQLFKSIQNEKPDEKQTIASLSPFVNIITQSKNLFDSIFSSKHISTKETLTYFVSLLDSNTNLSNITLYNIAYYLSMHNSNVEPFEKFEKVINDDIIWNRIIYVDVNMLKLKKQMNEKQYLRIKRKMMKHKFYIQDLFKKQLSEQKIL